MTKTVEVLRFELAYQLRRRSTLVYAVILVAMCPIFMRMMWIGSSLDGTYFNSPFTVMVMVVFGSMLALLPVAAVAGDAATRDAETRIDSLFYTSPVGKRAYLSGRFLGAFAVSALLLLLLPIGSVVATWMPWVPAESLAPFSASAHFDPYLLVALPNAFVATTLIFALAALTRRMLASYAGAAFLFFTAIVCQKALAPRIGWDLAKLLDPLGFTTVQAFWRSTNVGQKNAFVLPADGALLTNRLIWVGFGLTIISAAYARIRFTHTAVGGAASALPASVESPAISVPIPTARRVFDRATRMRQLVAITMRSFRDLHASRAWWIVPLLALFFINEAPELAKNELGVPGALTTARLAEFLAGDVSIFITLLIALSAGELVWRERGARIHPLADVTPVPHWLSFVGKFLGLALMLVATLVIFLFTGLAVQAMAGAERFELPLHLQIVFGLQLPEYLLIAALAMFVHVVVNQKHIATALVVLSPFVVDIARSLGVDDLLLYGSLPKWSYSEISGFGFTVETRLWFALYFGGWALLFALVAYLFWIRGEESGLRQRLALARRRLTRPVAAGGIVALATVASLGGFIFYNTHILNDHRSAAELEDRRADYERRYHRYASLPQPALAATRLLVDFYPRQSKATIHGTYRLENRSTTPIDAVHLATTPGVPTSNVHFDRASRVTLTDETHGYRIYALERALEPGESLRMEFQVSIESGPFKKHGLPPVVDNGSVLIHRPGRGDHWLPLVGYQPSRELDNPVLRKKHRLRERSPYPLLTDANVRSEARGYERVELETIVGTDAGQLGVAPGERRRSWFENGRRYTQYVTEQPISHAWTITSARYALTASAAPRESVAIEVVHDPSHTANVERMLHSVRASLDTFEKEFGAYPYRQLRLVEYPTHPYWLQLTAHTSMVTFSEGFSLVRSQDDPRRIDLPFAVIAHEVAHQWWGHQLTPANVEGGAFLAESLAWYSAMLVVEETFGREHLQRLLDAMRAQYYAPNQPRAFPLLRAVDSLDAYRTGPFAMYALREAVGADTVNQALRNLLAKFPAGRAPYPTSLDFYAELRAATPPSAHRLLKDLFEDITYWELRATTLDVKAGANGTYRVTLHVDAQKLKGDGTGKETAVRMDDTIEIALFGADGSTIYRALHRIRDGAQTIDLTVTRAPARAVIDPDRELLDRSFEDNEVATSWK